MTKRIRRTEGPTGDLAELRRLARAMRAAVGEASDEIAEAADLLLAMESGEHQTVRQAHNLLIDHAIDDLKLYGGVEDSVAALLNACYSYFGDNSLPETSRWPDEKPATAPDEAPPPPPPAGLPSAPDGFQLFLDQIQGHATETRDLARLLYETVNGRYSQGEDLDDIIDTVQRTLEHLAAVSERTLQGCYKTGPGDFDSFGSTNKKGG